MRRRAQRPSFAEVVECVSLGCYRREECPDPKRFAELSDKIAAWEREQERLKDPVGALCKRMNDRELTGVFFADGSKPTQPAVRLRFRREESLRYEIQEPVGALSDWLMRRGARDAKAVTVLIPKVDLAETVELSPYMLSDDEWDYEDEICAQLKLHAARLLVNAEKPLPP